MEEGRREVDTRAVVHTVRRRPMLSRFISRLTTYTPHHHIKKTKNGGHENHIKTRSDMNVGRLPTVKYLCGQKLNWTSIISWGLKSWKAPLWIRESLLASSSALSGRWVPLLLSPPLSLDHSLEETGLAAWWREWWGRGGGEGISSAHWRCERNSLLETRCTDQHTRKHTRSKSNTNNQGFLGKEVSYYSSHPFHCLPFLCCSCCGLFVVTTTLLSPPKISISTFLLSSSWITCHKRKETEPFLGSNVYTALSTSLFMIHPSCVCANRSCICSYGLFHIHVRCFVPGRQSR